MARNYNNSTLVFVTISGFPVFKYGFRSRLKDNLRDDLGQTVLTAANASTNLTGLAIGVNNPKPPIATKVFQTGSESSYIDSGKIITAQSKGWSIKRGKRGIFSAKQFSELKYVVINGIKYGWRGAKIPDDIASLVKFSDYDVKIVSGSDLVIYGAEFPKPPRVYIPFGIEADADAGTEAKSGTASSFIPPAKIDEAQAAGYSVTGGAYTLDDLKQIYGLT